MPVKKVLALSSSRAGSGAYLESALPFIHGFLGNAPLNIGFIPFAAVDRKYDNYVNRVQQALAYLPYTVNVALPNNSKHVIAQSDVIMVGGGNTFKLLHDIYDLQLLELMIEKVEGGAPYIGWSAGSNIAGL